jgi:uncharacterized repeat protein (TIGR03803 family)
VNTLARLTITVAAATLFASCGASQPPIGAPGAVPQGGPLAPTRKFGHLLTSPSYTVLYRFHKGNVNGSHPQAGLIDVNGTLYGTTVEGGPSGYGTVYSISPTGTENVLHSFTGSPDGAAPEAELVDVNGTLYGTTFYGGVGAGTVYSISPSGVEQVVYSFHGGSDGYSPQSELINVNGTLYGTTDGGGVSGCYCGTVFSLTTKGKHTVLHDFGPSLVSDGSVPRSGLIAVNGTLYGTTAYGGGTGCGGVGCGTVYSISPSGAEKVLYSFAAGADGEAPLGSLVDVNGTLYGTTAQGGGSGCELGVGCGTIYSITTNGIEKVVYSFAGDSDGAHPIEGLIDLNGTLYGATINGGGSGCTYPNYCGTVFSVSTGGTETVLHKFTYEPDGLKPWMRLLNVNATLYGTTTSGGRGCPKRGHCGVVFALTP